jgi:hypothetical protein
MTRMTCRPKLSEVRVGNVYKAYANGPRGRIFGTVWWLVVAISTKPPDAKKAIFWNAGVHMLGLNRVGEIVSTTSYGLHVMEQRECWARVKGVEDFAAYLRGEIDLPVEW